MRGSAPEKGAYGGFERPRHGIETSHPVDFYGFRIPGRQRSDPALDLFRAGTVGQRQHAHARGIRLHSMFAAELIGEREIRRQSHRRGRAGRRDPDAGQHRSPQDPSTSDTSVGNAHR